MHPDDNIVVLFNGPNVDRLIRFLQQAFDPDELYTRREYASSGREGVWKRGGKFVKMVKTDDGWKFKKKEIGDSDEDDADLCDSDTELPDADDAS